LDGLLPCRRSSFVVVRRRGRFHLLNLHAKKKHIKKQT